MQLKPSLLLWAQIQLLENVSVPTPVTTRNLPISVDYEGNFLRCRTQDCRWFEAQTFDGGLPWSQKRNAALDGETMLENWWSHATWIKRKARYRYKEMYLWTVLYTTELPYQYAYLFFGKYLSGTLLLGSGTLIFFRDFFFSQAKIVSFLKDF